MAKEHKYAGLDPHHVVRDPKNAPHGPTPKKGSKPKKHKGYYCVMLFKRHAHSYWWSFVTSKQAAKNNMRTSYYSKFATVEGYDDDLSYDQAKELERKLVRESDDVS